MNIHIVKRDNCPLWKKMGMYALAVLAALTLGGILLMMLGVSEETATSDACKLEHAISDESFEAIKRWVSQMHLN